MVKETAVSVILYHLNSSSPNYLLLKYAVYGQTHWDFVKGRMEPGESEEETAIRECLEEAGISGIKTKKGFRKEHSYEYKKLQEKVLTKE